MYEIDDFGEHVDLPYNDTYYSSNTLSEMVNLNFLTTDQSLLHYPIVVSLSMWSPMCYSQEVQPIETIKDQHYGQMDANPQH